MSELRDERVIATRQRWATHGFGLLFIALSIDLMVRALLLKQDPRQWLDIALIWMATMLFVFIGMTASGVAPYGGKWLLTWLVILVITVTNTVVLTLLGGVHTRADLIATIVITAAGAFVVIIILRGIYSVWERVKLGRVPREE